MHDEIGAMVCLKDRKRIFLSSPGKMPHTKLSGRMFDIDMLSFFPICKILVWLMALYMTELWCPIVHLYKVQGPGKCRISYATNAVRDYATDAVCSESMTKQ